MSELMPVSDTPEAHLFGLFTELAEVDDLRRLQHSQQQGFIFSDVDARQSLRQTGKVDLDKLGMTSEEYISYRGRLAISVDGTFFHSHESSAVYDQKRREIRDFIADLAGTKISVMALDPTQALIKPILNLNEPPRPEAHGILLPYMPDDEHDLTLQIQQPRHLLRARKLPFKFSIIDWAPQKQELPAAHGWMVFKPRVFKPLVHVRFGSGRHQAISDDNNPRGRAALESS